MAKIEWNDNGWTSVQEADPVKHILGVDCRAENGKVVEVRTRHQDGEEVTAKVMLDGEPALPMDIKVFKKHFAKHQLEFK